VSSHFAIWVLLGDFVTLAGIILHGELLEVYFAKLINVLEHY
jgi:hypothetical protein